VRSETDAALSLLSAAAVRQRAHRMLEAGLADQLPHFRVDLRRLDDAAALTIAITRDAYPDLAIPFHSRWRHFVVDGADRWAARANVVKWKDAASRARAEFDLAIVSVLLDAGAGAQWRYRDQEGRAIGRSEGLAIASLDMFVDGLFSSDPQDTLRADAAKLAALADGDLAAGFQANATNPLAGLAGRADLLRRLGRTIAADPTVFAACDSARPGGLYDHLVERAAGGRIAAADILAAVLRYLGPIWPSRLTVGGIALGDCWRHPAIVTDDATNGLVPLHKLSQWLTYSLIEPLERAGITVTDIDGLTGLAEYRNGGLFIDIGTLAFRNPDDARQRQTVDSTIVVEWRALTVALLDRLADLVRQRLGRNAEELPLARILQGGTWAAGRMLARKLRPDAAPPIAIESDGTVF
jgi:Protein of unknown function (DUF1688)